MVQLQVVSTHNSLLCAPSEIQVSVIIPAYKASATIVRAIDSVRAQRGVHTEIIIIDDASPDDTAETVRADMREGEQLLLERLPRNAGVSAARNAGIRLARGNYLAFLDADDVWLPEKLALQLAVIQRDPSISLVSCNSQKTAPDGSVLKIGHENRPPVNGPDAWKTLLAYNFVPTPTVLTRTALVRELGGFDVNLPVGEDLDLWIRLGVRGRIEVLPQVLIRYYDFSNSLMKRHSQQAGTIVVPMLEKHIREQSSRLLPAEVRALRGMRSFQIGCDTYFSGGHWESAPLFLRSALLGHRPIKSLTMLPRALLLSAAQVIGLRRRPG